MTSIRILSQLLMLVIFLHATITEGILEDSSSADNSNSQTRLKAQDPTPKMANSNEQFVQGMRRECQEEDQGDFKPRGRMSSYAYFVQTAREEHKKKHPNTDVVFDAFSKECAERWKRMDEKEKSKYTRMADEDRKRYDHEMSDYVPAKEDKKKEEAKVEDPNAPKPALSAFFWFCSDERPKVEAMLGADPSVGDVAKELGKKWNALSGPAKSKYEGLAAKDKARYEKEISAYKAEGGGAGVGVGGKKGAKSKKVVAGSTEEESEEQVDD